MSAVNLVTVIGVVALFTSVLAWPHVSAGRIEGVRFYLSLMLTSIGAAYAAGGSGMLTVLGGLAATVVGGALLCGSRRDSRAAQEAALKFLAYGGFSAGVSALGAALVYREVSPHGALVWGELSRAVTQNEVSVLGGIGVALVFAGLVSFLAAVPFHMWAPDVLEGAPTPAAMFVSAATKVAAVGALWRLVDSVVKPWNPHAFTLPLDVLVASTVIVGNLVAVRQVLVKRMVAYATIAQGGYLLAAIAHGGESVVFFAMVSDVVVTLGVFGGVGLYELRESRHDELELADLDGAGLRQPVVAVALAVLLLSMAGIPPSGGALARLLVFLSVVESGRNALLVLLALGSVAGAYVYLRLLVRMYFHSGRPPGAPITSGALIWWLRGGVVLCAVATVAAGVWPRGLLWLGSGR
ncbi:MAG: proton-conducting transporter membrane subunit [Myxococcota bacterium]